MDARTILGWNLRALRVRKGYSQEKLALQSGVDRSYVGRIERGSENVTISVLETLALALDEPILELFRVPPDNAARPSALNAGRKTRPK